MKIPLVVLRLVNPFVGLLLRSPLHGLMSADVMLITVTGRRSGRRYTMPVSYLRDGDRVRCLTGREMTWWRNLRGGADVTLQLAGEERRGRAEAVVDDADRIERALADFLTRLPRDAVYYEVGLDGAQRPLEADVQRAADHVVPIEIRL
jgi:deazaflavin-dependent oxidoreductase (nitroreductase family)